MPKSRLSPALLETLTKVIKSPKKADLPTTSQLKITLKPNLSTRSQRRARELIGGYELDSGYRATHISQTGLEITITVSHPHATLRSVINDLKGITGVNTVTIDE